MEAIVGVEQGVYTAEEFAKCQSSGIKRYVPADVSKTREGTICDTPVPASLPVTACVILDPWVEKVAIVELLLMGIDGKKPSGSLMP